MSLIKTVCNDSLVNSARDSYDAARKLTCLSASNLISAWSRDMTAESNHALFLLASRIEFLLLVRPMHMDGLFRVRMISRSGKAKVVGGSRAVSNTITK